MIVLLSPTKTQKESDIQLSKSNLLFEAKKEKLLKQIQKLSLSKLQKEMKLSDTLAQKTHDTYQNFKEQYIALDTYDGLVFKNMNISSWTQETRAYAQEHLLILSALYGCVKPMDVIAHYRLDFLHDCNLDLYKYWNKTLSDALSSINELLLDLSSKEYSAVISWENLKVPYCRIDFKEKDGKTKATLAKILRGKLTKLIMEERINSFEELLSLNIDGYTFNASKSTEHHLIFSK